MKTFHVTPSGVKSAISPRRGFWIKCYTSTLENVGIATLPDNLWRLLQSLELILGHEHPSGILPSIQEVAFRLRQTEEQIIEGFRELLSRGLLVQNGESYILPNFCEEQGPDTPAERKARQRERERSEAGSHEAVTNRDTERKKERSEQKDHIIDSAPPAGDAGECDDDFDRFWSAYPRKVKKEKARQDWIESADHRPSIEEITASIERSIAGEWKGKEERYIPEPGNWIKNSRWSDEGLKIEPKPTANPLAPSIDEEDAFRWRCREYPPSAEIHPTSSTFPFKNWPGSLKKEYRDWKQAHAPGEAGK
jgi:hypothetical protein